MLPPAAQAAACEACLHSPQFAEAAARVLASSPSEAAADGAGGEGEGGEATLGAREIEARLAPLSVRYLRRIETQFVLQRRRGERGWRAPAPLDITRRPVQPGATRVLLDTARRAIFLEAPAKQHGRRPGLLSARGGVGRAC